MIMACTKVAHFGEEENVKDELTRICLDSVSRGIVGQGFA